MSLHVENKMMAALSSTENYTLFSKSKEAATFFIRQ